MIYSKVLEPSDYEEIGESVEYYRNIEATLGDLVRPQHPARMWEYGRLIKILGKTQQTLVDIGGSGSALPQCCATMGHKVAIIDFDDESERINNQNKILNTDVKFFAADFLDIDINTPSLVPKKWDIVVCVSTIEHVPDDNAFFLKMLDSCNDLLYLTCDFFTSSIHPNEPPTYKNWVNRTYTKEKLMSMLEIAQYKGFDLYNNIADWDWKGPHVYNYNFASLILERRS